jgi:HEPN domain-containing protein
MESNRVEHSDGQMTDLDEIIPLISDWLEYFDVVFEKQKISIPKRPLSTVIELVELDVIQMGKGEETFSKDTLLSPPWVGYLLRSVFRWYDEKYGKEACTERKDDRIKSYIIIKNLPYSILIPKTTSVQFEGEPYIHTSMLGKVLEQEDVIQWIQKAPKFAALDEQYLENLREQITHRANLLRYIYLKGLFVRIDNESMQNAFRNALGSLNLFIEDLFRNYTNGVSLGVWHLYYSVENVLKALRYSLLKKVKKTHDVSQLYSELLLLVEGHSNTVRFLSENSNDYKFGAKRITSSEELDNIYMESLEIIAWVIRNLTKDINLRDECFDFTHKDFFAM